MLSKLEIKSQGIDGYLSISIFVNIFKNLPREGIHSQHCELGQKSMDGEVMA